MNNKNTNNKQETEVKILVDTTEKVEQHEENGKTTDEVKTSAVEETETEAKILIHMIEAIREEINNFSEHMEKSKSSLQEELKQLKEYTLMLQTLPKKLGSQIQETIPRIATELSVINERQAELQKNSLTEARQKIEQLAIDISKIDKRRIINLFIGVIISSAIAACGATYAASYMMKSFPTRVAIQHPENIILYDSNVSLWDLSESNAKLNDSHKKFNKLKEDLEKIEKQIQNKKLRKNNTKDSTKP